MFLINYEWFLTWHRVRIYVTMCLGLIVYGAGVYWILERSRWLPGTDSLSAPIIYGALIPGCSAVFIYVCQLLYWYNGGALWEGRRPRANHPVWEVLRRINPPMRVTARILDPTPPSKFALMGLGSWSLRRRQSILVVPEGTSKKREYAKRKLPLMTAVVVHELEHAHHWRLITFSHLFFICLHCICIIVSCLWVVALVVTLLQDGSLAAYTMREIFSPFGDFYLVWCALSGLQLANSRSWEYIADSGIVQKCGQDGIDGLARFFGMDRKKPLTVWESALQRFRSLFRTHPGHERRIAILQAALHEQQQAPE